MITAHLPSGYVVGKSLPPRPWVLPAAVIGGVFPDLDLIWFYFVDDRAFHHHRYWVHIPLFWLCVAIPAILFIKRYANKYMAVGCAFFVAVFVHICLDSVAGDVLWAWPFSDEFFHLITVEAKYSHWILNFIFHPVFLLELLIWAIAAVLFVRNLHE